MSIMNSQDGYFNLRAANDAAKAAAYQNAPKVNPYMQQAPQQAPQAAQAPQSPVASGPLGGSSWKNGGKVKRSKASKRADGIAQRGKTKGRIV